MAWFRAAGVDPDAFNLGNGGMTEAEDRTYFGLWSMFKAPLLMGNDVRNMSAQTLAIYGAGAVVSNLSDLAFVRCLTLLRCRAQRRSLQSTRHGEARVAVGETVIMMTSPLHPH